MSPELSPSESYGEENHKGVREESYSSQGN